MKKIGVVLTALLVGLSSMTVSAQSSGSDLSQMPLSVIIPAESALVPEGVRDFLSNKLQQVVVANGVSSGSDYARYFLTAKVNTLSKDIIAGPPQQISQKFQLTCYIIDYVDKKIYASTTLEFDAVGTNETKSYMSGLKKINEDNKKLAWLIDTGKKKIVYYYDSQGRTIMKEAQALADKKKYEEAMSLLAAFPSQSVNYDRAMELGLQIFKQYEDFTCDVNLAKARSAWTAGQNKAAAEEAGKYLAKIYPDAKCYQEAVKLYNKIDARIKQEWDLELKKYDDSVSLEKQRIEAMRQIGVAYGSNQKPNTFVLDWLK